MRLASHLKRSRHGVFYFRLTIPESLRPLFAGRREIKRSLFTRDPALARSLAYVLSARYCGTLKEIRRMTRKGYDPSKFDPSDATTWPVDEKDIERYDIERDRLTGVVTKIKTDPNNPDDHANAMEFLREERLSASQIVELQRQQRLYALDLEARPLIEAAMMPMAASQPPAPQTPPALTLAEVQKKYEASLNDKNEHTRNDYMRAVKWFVDHIGQKMPIAVVTKEHVQAWKNVVKDHYLNISTRKQESRVKQGKLKPDPVAGLSEPEVKVASVDKIISRAHAFMVWAQQNRYFPRGEDLPTKSMTMLTHSQRKKLPGYQLFLHDELQQIFAKDNLLALRTPHEFWMPLLGLFTGARIGELAQLNLDDIRQDKDGHWVIGVNDKEFKKVKTDAARRQIPIHPKLIELGFLDYLTDVRATVPESNRVFPYLRYDKKNGFADVPSEAFGRYLDDLTIYADDKVFHSFRSTANQCLKENNVQPSVRSQLVGHEPEGTNEAAYAWDLPIGKMLDTISINLIFPELDFTPLKYPPGRFREFLPKEMLAAIKRKRTNTSEEKDEKQRNHEAAKAARLARTPKKRGRSAQAD
jgi:integrase